MSFTVRTLQQIEKDGIGGACNLHVGGKKCIQTTFCSVINNSPRQTQTSCMNIQVLCDVNELATGKYRFPAS